MFNAALHYHAVNIVFNVVCIGTSELHNPYQKSFTYYSSSPLRKPNKIMKIEITNTMTCLICEWCLTDNFSVNYLANIQDIIQQSNRKLFSNLCLITLPTIKTHLLSDIPNTLFLTLIVKYLTSNIMCMIVKHHTSNTVLGAELITLHGKLSEMLDKRDRLYSLHYFNYSMDSNG